MNAHARQRVDAYLSANLGDFIAMERIGTLEAHIRTMPPE
jgi:hypothetical protein